MKSIKKLFVWGLCITIISPILGIAGTFLIKMKAFDAVANKQGSEKAEVLAHYISFGLWSTAIGFILSLIGIVLLIICLLQYMRYQKEQKNTV